MICNIQAAFNRLPCTPYVKMIIFILGQLFLRTYKCTRCGGPHLHRGSDSAPVTRRDKRHGVLYWKYTSLPFLQNLPPLFTTTSLYSTSQVYSIRFAFQINATHTNSVSLSLSL